MYETSLWFNTTIQAPASSIDAFAAAEDVQDKFANFLKGSDQVWLVLLHIH
jgi:hypothetical protein